MKGRGTNRNIQDRFINIRLDKDQPEARVETQAIPEFAKSILSSNQSPDVPFNVSINPYRGCEHGCSYCYARSSHAYIGYSPGLDFETRIHYKKNTAPLLKKALSAKQYRCEPIALGNNTDAYQPLEQKLAITREVIRILADCQHPLTIVTKSSRILRDLDLLAPMAKDRLVHVFISVTTLDHQLARKMEPRACSPSKRLQTIRSLNENGVPVGVLVAPVIPGLTDSEFEQILSTAADAGAERAGYVMLRLPHEVKEIFFEWLQSEYGSRVEKVRRHLQSMHEGKAYQANFGQRMTGRGPIAELIAGRFTRACKKLNLKTDRYQLDTTLFSPPQAEEDEAQIALF